MADQLSQNKIKAKWTSEEDERLRDAVDLHKGKNWKQVAALFRDKTDVQCLHRWQKVLRPDLIKGPWTKEEDEKVSELVGYYGPKKWSVIASHLPGRIGKQCRERWHNHLNPEIKKDPWAPDEDEIIMASYQEQGSKWADIAKKLPGRTDNAIKNRWNSSIHKKYPDWLASKGVSKSFAVKDTKATSTVKKARKVKKRPVTPRRSPISRSPLGAISPAYLLNRNHHLERSPSTPKVFSPVPLSTQIINAPAPSPGIPLLQRGSVDYMPFPSSPFVNALQALRDSQQQQPTNFPQQHNLAPKLALDYSSFRSVPLSNTTAQSVEAARRLSAPANLYSLGGSSPNPFNSLHSPNRDSAFLFTPNVNLFSPPSILQHRRRTTTPVGREKRLRAPLFPPSPKRQRLDLDLLSPLQASEAPRNPRRQLISDFVLFAEDTDKSTKIE